MSPNAPRNFDHDAHAETGELASLHAERDFLTGDASFARRDRRDASPALVASSGVCSPLSEGSCTLIRVGTSVSREQASGEWIGLLLLRGAGTTRVAQLIDRLASEESVLLRTGNIDTLLNLLVEEGEVVSVVHTYGHWHDVDDEATLQCVRG